MLTDSSAPACAQATATPILPQIIEIQARKLRQRFALSPEAARLIATVVLSREPQA
ncbi:hypothetical protein RAD15_42695 [Bradyrhizobium sp. 14AA]